MIRIFIQGIKNGEHEVDMQVPVSEIRDFYPEFFGNIEIKGNLRKFGKRFTLNLSLACKAKLICDLSLKEFEETIEGNLKLSLLADSEMSRKLKIEKDEIAETEKNIISEDDKYIDITDEVREELIVRLPMRRVAPEYKEKSLKDIYPQYSSDANEDKKKTKKKEPDERWAPLKKLKLN